MLRVYRRKSAGCCKDRGRQRCAMTLVEILVAMAILVIVMAAIVPQIRAIRGSWDSKKENVEAIQNGRVLVDYITSQLAEANNITLVSDSSEADGYIEFLNNDGNTMRYEIDASNYVVYGPVGNLSELAGPVSQLQFTCYDACDLDTPIMDVNSIRTVKVQTTITNAAAMGRDQAFSGQAYLRANAGAGAGGDSQTVSEEPGSESEFDTGNGEEPALCQIDATHYLCAYGGAGGDGWAVILEVDTGNWTITHGTPLEFDTTACYTPALARIDATNYLCAYTGPQLDGWSVILTVDTGTGTITMGTPFEFDEANGEMPSLSQIDSDDYLCAYTGKTVKGKDHGWAVILTVDTVTKTITKGTPFEFDTNHTIGCALANIDNVHYLCTYEVSITSSNKVCRAVVFTVNTGTKTITKETTFQFDSALAGKTDLCKIDQNHYLCAYEGPVVVGYAVILTVDTGTWAIGKGTTQQYVIDQGASPALAWISGDDFLCAYGEFGMDGTARVFRTDTQTDSFTFGPAYEHDPIKGKSPALAKIDDTHFLCAYTGESDDGYAVILSVGGAILP